MLTIYTTPAYEGLLGGASPFIGKLEAWLRMAKIEHDVVSSHPATLLAEAPNAMVPFVDLNGERMQDSSIIIDRLKELHNDPLNDERLTEAETVQGKLLQSLCENELFNALAYGRWIDGDHETYSDFFFSELPKEQRKVAAGQIIEMVSVMLNRARLDRNGPDYMWNRLRSNLQLLEFSLGDGPWFFGDEPTTYDAAVFGQLASIIHFPVPNKDVEIAREFKTLVDYCDFVRGYCYDYHGA